MDKSFDFLNSKNGVVTLKKSSVGGFIGNMGIIIAAMTLLCTCVMFFTDISLASLVTTEFSLSFVILLFCSYTMYFSMADTGAKHGAENELFIKAKERYDSLRAELSESGLLFHLGSFCHEYVQNELVATQKNILLSAGISYSEFCEKYKGKDKREQKEALCRRTRSIVAKANALKPITLTPDMLLSVGAKSHSRNPLSKSPEKSRIIHSMRALIPTTVTSFFAVSVVCSVISDPSMATVTECIIKLFALVWNGCKGYTMGYDNVCTDYTAYLSNRSDILCAAKLSFAKKKEMQTNVCISG